MNKFKLTKTQAVYMRECFKRYGKNGYTVRRVFNSLSKKYTILAKRIGFVDCNFEDFVIAVNKKFNKNYNPLMRNY